MKNITKQYQDLLEGKMSKDNFMRNVRMEFPDWISPVNSFKDAIGILKSKRILSEHIHDLDITSAGHTNVKGQMGDYDPAARASSLKKLADFGPKQKPYYLVDANGKAVDSTMATSLQQATATFEDTYEGLLSSLTVTDIDPEELEEAIDKKGIEALRKGALREAAEKSVGAYKNVTGKDLYSINREIDRVNPYELKKGITIEMGMQYEPTPNYFTDKFNPEALAKAVKKVLKNLEKDPAYYTNSISLEFEKKTGMLQDPKELKVGPHGSAKIKGFNDAKSNTQDTSKRERAKGKPEGVKEMKPSKRSMGGIKMMKSNGKVPKGVEMMKENMENDETAFENLMKKYDWYAEMSDDSRKWDAQQAMERQLKQIAKTIGIEKAAEIWNKYAPSNRKEQASFFKMNEDKVASTIFGKNADITQGVNRLSTDDYNKRAQEYDKKQAEKDLDQYKKDKEIQQKAEKGDTMDLALSQLKLREEKLKKIKEAVVAELKKRLSEKLTVTVKKGATDQEKAAAINKARTQTGGGTNAPVDVIEA